MSNRFLRYGGSRRAALVGLAVAVAVASRATSAAATQIVVTTTADEATNDGDCSLREAFQAANGNAVRDACPAGSNTSTDQIVLADGALYSLIIPAGPGLAGTLVVANNGATTDIAISVAGGGSATISQDAVPDTSVIATTVGAKLDLTDVTIQGGTVGASDSGGAIFVTSGATVALLRCRLYHNVAGQRGGAIVNSGGTLIVQDSAFEANTAGDSGGAISAGSNTVTLIDNAFFANNVANGQFGGGGAIQSSSVLSLANSTLVNNRARTLGGAITHFHDVADEASISQSCFVGNEADFSHNAVDVFSGSQTLNAAGNWWGADDGPSGVASGHGDGVGSLIDVSPPSNVPLAGCLPLEMAANGGFQSDGDGDGIPQRWTGNRLTAADGRACAATGACIFKMRGNGALKQLSHTIRHAGPAGDTFLFKARSRAQSVPTSGGAYRAQVTIVHSDGSQQTSTLDFSTGKHGFERLNATVTANESYDEIRVRVEYGKASGVVRFDSVSLLLQE